MTTIHTSEAYAEHSSAIANAQLSVLLIACMLDVENDHRLTPTEKGWLNMEITRRLEGRNEEQFLNGRW